VKSIIELAHGLGLTVTAEGVETEEQLKLLRDLGCDVAQGYFVAEPLQPDQLLPWLDAFDERWHRMIGEQPQLPFRVPRSYMG
jgi:EAL domain-containing protein (putative c-di-GMP-specific phosphodiesterase class I)